MLQQIAEKFRQLAVRCAQLTKNCTDKSAAWELEAIALDLAEECKKLDTLSDVLEKPR